MPLSDTTRRAAARLVQRYPVARAALLPLLHLVQADQGHITEEGIAFCADALGLTKAEVSAVETFYTMFKDEPVGDWLLSVCTNPTCKVAGGQDIFDRYRQQLGGHHDEEDGVSVEHAECLGICDAAPVVQVNYEMYGPLTDDEADELLAAVREGEPPASNWSGEVPGTFREVSWELSGAADGLDEQWAEAARQQIDDYDEPPAHRTGETDIPVTHPGGDSRGLGGASFRRDGGAAPGSMLTADGDGRPLEGPPPEGPPPREDAGAEAGDADAEAGAAEGAADADAAEDREPAGQPAEPAVQSATGGIGGSRPGGAAPPPFGGAAADGDPADRGDVEAADAETEAAGDAADADAQPGEGAGEPEDDDELAAETRGVAEERAEQAGDDGPGATPADASEPGEGGAAPADAADRSEGPSGQSLATRETDDEAEAAGGTPGDESEDISEPQDRGEGTADQPPTADEDHEGEG